MFTLRISTSYSENWRYNIMLTCALKDRSGKQIGFVSAEDSIMPVGSNSTTPPEGFVRQRVIEKVFEPCHSMDLCLYLLPNSLPETSTLKGEKLSFPIKITILNGDKTLFTEKWEVNRFGGIGRKQNIVLP